MTKQKEELLSGKGDHDRLKGRVLVVDDELPNRLFLRKILGSRGCEITEAVDGETACELTKESTPDLVLVDVMMPGMDGYEVCERLKSDPVTQEIPIIMVTAKTKIEDLERGFELGAMDYIRKPFNPRELIVRVRNALELKHTTDELRRWQQQMSHELELAGALQRTLLAMDPWLTNTLEVQKANRPSLNVGGDVFDIVQLPDRRMCLYVGDVCGHGVGPAMVTSLLKATISELVSFYANFGPSVICNALHRRFCHYIDDPALYATLFFGLYDPSAQEWHCLNCGHPAPILLDEKGRCLSNIFLQGGGTPIGLSVRGDSPYTEEDEVRFMASPGSMLFIYTDGLIETRRPGSIDECGIDQLTDIVRDASENDLIMDLPGAVFQELESRGYDLGSDDCSAISAHIIDDKTVVMEEQFPPDISRVSEAATQAEQRILAAGWPEEVAGAIQLLVMEHCANVIDHGKPPESMPIQMQIRLTKNTCRLLFVDNGREWNMQNSMEKASLPDDQAERGRGLAIMKSIAECIEAYRRENENHVRYVVRKDFMSSETE